MANIFSNSTLFPIFIVIYIFSKAKLIKKTGENHIIELTEWKKNKKIDKTKAHTTELFPFQYIKFSHQSTKK